MSIIPQDMFLKSSIKNIGETANYVMPSGSFYYLIVFIFIFLYSIFAYVSDHRVRACLEH